MCLGMNPGHSCRRASAALRRAIATSKAARDAADARIWSRRRWPRQPRLQDILLTFATGKFSRRGECLMEPFHTLTALAAPLDRANVDTDQIIPKQFLKRIERTGYGEFLFFDWRQTPDGRARSRLCAERSALQVARRFCRGQELWLRIEPRACSVGAERFWIPRGDRANVCRYLFFKRGQERYRAGAAERRAGSAVAAERADVPGYQLTVSLEEQTVTDSAGF